MSEHYVTTREVTPEECPWLRHRVPANLTVFRWHGPTYGCVSPSGVAVSERLGEYPFYELPADAVIECDCGDPSVEIDSDTVLRALVDWCGRGFDGDTCPICFGTTADCVPVVERDGCEHGYDCPWLSVLEAVS